MTELEVREVTAHGDDRALFQGLPGTIYAQDPHWAPASDEISAQCFDDAEAGLVALHPVLVTRGGRALARAAALIDPSARDAGGAQQGWIGLVECLPGEVEAGVRAVNECRGWLAESGIRSLAVPRSNGLVVGVQTHGFDRDQTYLTSHNPAWYGPMLEQAGLRRIASMRAFEFTRSRAPQFRPVPVPGVRIRHADPERVEADLGAVAGLQGEVFAGRAGHVDRTPAELRSLLERIRPAVDPDLIVLAEDDGGRTVGALICLVDLWQRRPSGVAPDRARLVSAGLVRDWRGRGVAVAMGQALAAALLDKGYRTLEASWVLVGNRRPQVVLLALGGRPSRRFALLG